MMIWIAVSIMMVIIIAGYLLSDSDGHKSKNVSVTIVNTIIAITCVILVWGGGLVDITGIICIILKLLEVQPIAEWSWAEVFMLLIVGIMAQFSGAILREAIK